MKKLPLALLVAALGVTSVSAFAAGTAAGVPGHDQVAASGSLPEGAVQDSADSSSSDQTNAPAPAPDSSDSDD